MTWLQIGQTLVSLEHLTTVDLEACVTQAGKPDRPTAVRLQFSNGRERHFYEAEAETLRDYFNHTGDYDHQPINSEPVVIDLTPLPATEPAP